MIDPPRKYKRLFVGTEVRLMNAYFVTCTGYEADDDGTVRVVHCTYDPATKGGNAPDGRKVKGTIHWVEATNAKEATVRLYENIVDEEKGVYNKEDGSLNVNPNSLTTVTAYVEPALMEAKGYDSYPVRKKRILSVQISMIPKKVHRYLTVSYPLRVLSDFRNKLLSEMNDADKQEAVVKSTCLSIMLHSSYY